MTAERGPAAITFGAVNGGVRVKLDGVSVLVAPNDDGEVTVGIDTGEADNPVGREWPHLYVWLNDATLHAPEGEPRDVTEASR